MAVFRALELRYWIAVRAWIVGFLKPFPASLSHSLTLFERTYIHIRALLLAESLSHPSQVLQPEIRESNIRAFLASASIVSAGDDLD